VCSFDLIDQTLFWDGAVVRYKRFYNMKPTDQDRMRLWVESLDHEALEDWLDFWREHCPGFFNSREEDEVLEMLQRSFGMMGMGMPGLGGAGGTRKQGGKVTDKDGYYLVEMVGENRSSNRW